MPRLEIRKSTLASPDAARLIAALNAELKAEHPEPGSTHFSLSSEQVSDGQGAFLIAWMDGVAVGCGAVRRLDEKAAELKRMYVEPQVRGQGVGRALVRSLEEEARALGVTKVVLETGQRLARAIRMYEGLGYVRIPLFGEYRTSPDTSVCFGKSLV
jgi:GNAT superfamily N-acetyltransferase